MTFLFFSMFLFMYQICALFEYFVSKCRDISCGQRRRGEERQRQRQRHTEREREREREREKEREREREREGERQTETEKETQRAISISKLPKALLVSTYLVACGLNTWSIGADSGRVEAGPDGGSRLQFGVGELGQVGHHGQLVHLRVGHLLRVDQLQGERGETQC